MPKIKITIIESRCRGGYCKTNDVFIVEDLCPPLCHELWHSMYPFVYALQNGANLDYSNKKRPMFDMKCPDEGRVVIHAERIEEQS